MKNQKDDARLAVVKCPVCKKLTAWRDNPFRPFCSERCRLVDLGKWAAEEYRVPESGKGVASDKGAADKGRKG